MQAAGMLLARIAPLIRPQTDKEQFPLSPGASLSEQAHEVSVIIPRIDGYR